MKNLFAGFALSLIFAIAACQQTATNGNQTTAKNQNGAVKKIENVNPNIPNPGVARISIQDAQAEVAAGKAVFVDVRGTSAFKEKHITGALDMNDVAADFGKLPKDKKIITYCT